MGDVIDIVELRPHVRGQAKCLQCKHEWAAVAPLGTPSLECPECSLLTGAWQGVAVPHGGMYSCHCGCVHWFVDQDKDILCALCGDILIFGESDHA